MAGRSASRTCVIPWRGSDGDRGRVMDEKRDKALDDLCEAVQDLTAAVGGVIGYARASDILGRVDAVRKTLQESKDEEEPTS